MPAAQQKGVLDQIAYRENAHKHPALGPGVKFFSLLRDLTTDGFFTSKIGIKYLEYIGNTVWRNFPVARLCLRANTSRQTRFGEFPNRRIVAYLRSGIVC